MVSITRLPDEIISYILMYENINIKDVLNIGLTCKQFNTAINNNLLWRCKFFQRWPFLREAFTEESCNENTNMKESLKKGIIYKKELLLYLSLIPYMDEPESCYKYGISRTMNEFDFLFHIEGAHLLRYYYFHNELIKMINGDIKDRHTNLTHEYCARIFLVYMRQCYVKSKWQALMDLPCEQQTLEHVATLVAQWCQPYKLVFYSHIAASLDNIAQRVLNVLKDLYPTHSIFTTCSTKFSFWKSNNISDNYWNKIEARQIVDVLGKVIFHELDFRGCEIISQSRHLSSEIFLIDQVLKNKQGSPISMAIIIHSVARRLGVRSDLVSLPSHFFLSWRESYKTDTKENCHYIDLFSDGSILSEKDCLKFNWINRESQRSLLAKKFIITPVEVMLRLSRSLECTDLVSRNHHFVYKDSLLRLQRIVAPYCSGEIDASNLSWYSDIASYMYYPNISDDQDDSATKNAMNMEAITDVTSRLGIFKKKLESKLDIKSRIREKHLKYAVGMLVKYIRYDSINTAVIIGWRSECSKKCDHYIPSCLSPLGLQETAFDCDPHYKLLCNSTDDTYNKNTYKLSQKHIQPLNEQKWINNMEIGRYFSHFEGTHYVPNESLQRKYPDDMKILEQKYSGSEEIFNISKKIKISTKSLN